LQPKPEENVRSYQDLYLNTVIAAMIVIREFQLGIRTLKNRSQIKGDGTLLTEADLDVGDVVLEHLSYLPSDAYEIFLEEDKGRFNPDAPIRAEADEVDGTRIFRNGGKSSTFIIGEYDKRTRRVIGCAVGLASTGEIWYSFHGQHTTRVQYDFNTKQLSHSVYVSVNNDLLGDQGTVAIDINKGFVRGKKPNRHLVLNTEQTMRFFGGLSAAGINIAMQGSNGYHQALVANGWEGMVGSATLAMGGERDAFGGYLVAQADGVGVAYSCTESGLVERDPMDPFSYDVLLLGNNIGTVGTMASILKASM
jgi:fructose-1,6-bisphosphatase/inositol monophosphatase family enzyme